MFGLSVKDVLNKKLINERYKIAIKKLHPDKWASENDPVLSKNATSAVVQMTEARDVLLKNIERKQS
jgi:DnaJ-class molecular chaperone